MQQYTIKFFQILILFSIPSLGGCSNGMKFKPMKYVKKEKIQIANENNLYDKKRIRKNIITSKVLEQNNYLIDSNQSLKLYISTQSYTRLSIKDERITDVFVYPREDLDLQIHNQGYVVLVPNFNQEDDKSAKEIYLTITGERGTTQDLVLSLIGDAPEPIILINPNLE